VLCKKIEFLKNKNSNSDQNEMMEFLLGTVMVVDDNYIDNLIHCNVLNIEC